MSAYMQSGDFEGGSDSPAWWHNFKIGGGFYETDSDRRGVRTSHPALTARAADGAQRKDRRPASGRDGCGDADIRAADPVLHRSHPGARPERAERQQRDRAESGRARHGAERRCAARQGEGIGTAPRDPGPAQGQHRYRRQDADHGGILCAARQTRHSRFDGRRKPARDRSGAPGQDQSLRMGELPFVLLQQRLVGSRWAQ